MHELTTYSEETFEAIKHHADDGSEYWLARELQRVLEYAEWRNFTKVIDKAKIACKNSGMQVEECFVEVNKTSPMPNGGEKLLDDMVLSRYACYLIVQNADPKKAVVAVGQTYFAVKTRQQELSEEQFKQLSEDQKRLAIRNEMKEHNKRLVDAAKDAGVETSRDYAIFQDEGYKGLYGGLRAKDIHARKGLKKSQKILDHMGSEELAANLFRATQTESKLRRENIHGKERANQTHYQVGSKVRVTIAELGGTMPEDLSTPDKSIQQLERKSKREKLKE